MESAKKTTGRKKAEEDFRESAEKYKTIFSESPIGIFYFNCQGIITECNEKFIAIIGSPRSVLIGFNMLKRLKDKLLIRAIAESLETGQSYYEDQYFSVTSNKKTYVKIILKGFRNSDNKIIAGIGLVEDITEQKLAKKALQDREHHFRTLFKNSPIPLCENDFSDIKINIDSLKQKGIRDFKKYFEDNPEQAREYAGMIKILESNKPVLELFGANSKDELLKGLPFVFTDEFYDTFKRGLIAIAKGHANYEFDAAIKTLNGIIKYIHLKWVVVKGYEETWEKVYVAIVDITDRVKAEEVRKESEEKYRELFENSNDCIILHNLEGHIINVNNKTTELFGYSLSEFLSMNTAGLHINEENEKSREAFKDVAEKGYTGFIVDFKKKNGEIFTGQVSSTLFELRGTPVVQGIIRDITQQQKNEKALRESEEWFRLAFRTSPDAFSLTRMEDGLIIDMNQGFNDITGYKREEVIGKLPQDLNIWTDMRDRARFLAELKQHGEVKNLEFQFRLKDGRVIPALISARSVELNGVPHLLSIAKSVEELKQAQIEILKSKESAENYLNISAEIILALDPRGNITLLNDSGYQLLGYKKGSLFGKNWFVTCLPETTRHEMRKIFEKLMYGDVENLETYENVVITKDGTKKIIHWHNSLLKDKKKQITGTLSSGEDITSRVQAEMALKESERKVNTIFNNLQGIAYRCKNDADWTMEFISSGFEEITGYATKDIINNNKLSFNDLIVYDDRKKVRDEVESALKRKDHFELYYRIKTASGEIKHVMEKGIGIFPEGDDEPIALEGFISDISRQVHLDEALRESEARYRSLIENSNDAIYLLYNRKFEIINNKFTQIFGYTLEDVNSPDFDFIHLVAPKSKPLVEGRFKRLVLGKKIANKYEFTAITKNGKEVEVEVSVSYINYKNGKATQGIIRDITERKQRNEITRKAILDIQEKEKIKFGKELHDGLGQILTSASMFLESLYQIKNQLPEKKRLDLERARQLNKQAILDARRISHGLMIAGIEDQGIDDLIRKMCQNSNTSKTSFSFYPRNIVDQKINTETKVHLYRIIQELSTNIIRHSDATQAKIWLSVLSNDILKLIVTDNGTGIKPEKLKSGTGLQNINQRVTILKGKIDISSGIGIGTRITVTVPL